MKLKTLTSVLATILTAIILASCSGSDGSQPIGAPDADSGWLIPIAISNKWTYRTDDNAQYTVSIAKTEVLYWKKYMKTSTLVSNNNMAYVIINDTLFTGSIEAVGTEDPVPFPRDPSDKEVLNKENQRMFVYIDSVSVPAGDFYGCWGESINGRIVNWYKQDVGMIKKYDPITKTTHVLIDFILN